jgi:rubredoxin
MNGWLDKLLRRDATTIRILSSGGQLTCAQLRQTAEAAMALGIALVRVGDRQSLTIKLKETDQANECRRLFDALPWRVENRFRPPATNDAIVSSLPFHGLGAQTGWLAERHFHDILTSLETVSIPPEVSVGLIDPQQRWMARHEGTIHFLASPTEDFWRLTLRPDMRQESWVTPYAVHGGSIAESTRALIEVGVGGGHFDPDSLKKAAAAFLNRGWIEQRDPLPPAPRHLRPCDGFLRQRNGRLSLGLAASDFTFPARFLMEAALLAQRQSLRRIGITPWRQLIFRDIEEDAGTPAWRLLLARHGIAIRRAPPCSFFWRVGADNAELLQLRSELIDSLDRRLGPAADISIALIDGEPTPANAGSTSVVIRQSTGRWGRRRYDLFCREGLAGADGALRSVAARCRRSLLEPLLFRLVNEWVSGIEAPASAASAPDGTTTESVVEDRRAHCRECLTVYDPAWGDPRADVAPGTPFENLAEEWPCPVCEAPKSAYAAGAVLIAISDAKGTNHEHAA